MTERAHGTRTRYVWGPDENDTPGKPCRCDDCRAVATAAERHRERMILYGRWQPFVDAGPAREHVRMLGRAGIGWRRAAGLAGVSSGAVAKLLRGGPGDRPPTRRIRPETERKILAVSPGIGLLGAGARIDATATRRRLQALVCCGYSQQALAARLGVPGNFRAVTAGLVTAATARAVAALYDELWDVPPPESTHHTRISASRARNYARARGWAPPLAWDDDTIADPDASPAEGWERPERIALAALIEDAAEIIAWEGSRELAAERMGVKRASLDQAIARAGRAS
jgi:hypothetical protein